MFFSIEEQINYLSKFMKLNEGDLLLSGTPQIKPLTDGDKIDARLIYNNETVANI